ncbi:UNVERIFIED_CONTAM: putative WD repeat-containing protein C17D11.16 [Sesamum calycinum]|uniref:WD repeat-containing protein C17D11.16 n=1 Tax=Sesamum calycinum TaxID=2727403 RepID=A0AAW2SEX9_9LAMI
MIAAVSWVPKGASKSVPIAAEPPSKEEIEEILKSGVLEINEGTENEENSEDMNVDALKQDDELAHALRELDMDRYDEEDDGVELFGSGLANLYYPSNDMDPYLKNQEDDSEEEEDITIKPEDAVIVCARNEDDVSHLEVWILEDPTDGDSNMYVHHDIVIPAFPLCTAWLDCPLKGGERGNFIAVGSMEPAIEIWDLDIMDEVQPSATLGGIIEKKKKGKKKSVKYKDGSHTDSVLGLAWNKEYRNILASASADKLVKIWDVATETCNITLENHTDKVQAVAWNHFAPQVLLSGSFDHSVVMKDGRLPSHSGFKWSVAADVESLAWDPHTEHSFVVCALTLVNVDKFIAESARPESLSKWKFPNAWTFSCVVGKVLNNWCCSNCVLRSVWKMAWLLVLISVLLTPISSPAKPSFTLHAHDKAVSTIAYNSSVPNLLATGSMDKMGAVFSISFSEDCPFTLAIGGSKGKLQVWDLLSDAEVVKRFGKIGQEIDMCAEISMAARMLESLPVLRYLVRRVLSCRTVKGIVMLNR